MAQVDSVDAGVVSGWACSRDARPLHLSIYVDGILVAEPAAGAPVSLPPVAQRACRLDPRDASARPVGYSARLPPLRPGRHVLRIFVYFPEDAAARQEVSHSPLLFVESPVEPSAQETVRRKDAIIVRRNAELAALWDEVRTQVPWRRAEQAGEAQDAEERGGGGKRERFLAVVLVHTVREL